jgi:hypothetical protein
VEYTLKEVKMKKLLLILVLVSYLFAAGGSAPSRTAVEGMYEQEEVKAWTYSSLDTLDGADSISLFNGVGFDAGWQYILGNDALSGDSAANTVLTIIVVEKSNLDCTITHNIIDTLAAAGSKILLPISTTLFGTTFDVWAKSGNANDETVIRGLWLWKRRPFVWDRKRPY